jgi:hypothetical protein
METDGRLAAAIQKIRDDEARASKGQKANSIKDNHLSYIPAEDFDIHGGVDRSRPNQQQKSNSDKLDADLVQWTKAVAKYTKWLVIVGFVGAIIALGTLCAIHGQLDEMQAEQRPWIVLQSLAGTIDSRGVIRFNIVMEKIGRLPTKFFATDGRVVDGEYAWIDEAEKICGELRQGGLNSFAAIPNSKWPIPSERLPSAEKIPAIALHKMDVPFLAGCAIYSFNGDAAVHQTPFGAHLSISGSKIEADRVYASDAD